MKYKIEIWQWGHIVETYERDDIEEGVDWYYSESWCTAYDNGLCAVEIYENGEKCPFEKAVKLGFY